jgi:hypothetical protein
MTSVLSAPALANMPGSAPAVTKKATTKQAPTTPSSKVTKPTATKAAQPVRKVR